MTDLWASGDAYEAYVGRWSRVVSRRFLEWLDIAPDQRWLDVGCGTGALTTGVLTQTMPRSVRGVDRSRAFVDFARAHIDDPRATFDELEIADLPEACADVVVCGLVLNFLPDRAAALAAMRRAAPTGTIAAYVWDYAGRMELMRVLWDSAIELDPAALDLDEGRRSPICAPEPLAAAWRDAGLVDVETTAIDVPTVFADFDDYWRPFLGGVGPAPNYVGSLSDEARLALRERVRAALPIASDGSIALVARAWAVRGRSAV